MSEDFVEWIAVNCKVIRDKRGAYAHALKSDGSKLTKFSREYVVAIRRISKIAKRVVPPPVKTRETLKVKKNKRRKKKEARGMVVHNPIPNFSRFTKPCWRRLPGQDAGVNIGAQVT